MGETRLPLFPLADVVHFPRTHLRLRSEEPAHRRLLRELSRREEEQRRLGMVLLKPGGAERAGQAHPEVFPGGTAARVVETEFLPDGRVEALLYGEFRFQLTGEVAHETWREGLVRPVFDPPLNEDDAGLQVVRRAVVSLAHSLAEELRERFPLGAEEIEELAGRCGFEELINRIAADLDLPVLRKLQLLCDAVPERALSILATLHGRRQVIDLLRPYRHLAAKSEMN